MPDTLTLYSFSDADRSGKVRWVAEELVPKILGGTLRSSRHLLALLVAAAPVAQAIQDACEA